MTVSCRTLRLKPGRASMVSILKFTCVLPMYLVFDAAGQI